MQRASAPHHLPEFTERTSDGARTQDPYSKLFSERIVFLGTPVDEAGVSDVMAQFLYLEHADPDRDIQLYINSPGGSFSAMTALYDTLQYVSCDVATTCLGQANSAAAVLLAAGAPGKRLMLPGSRAVIRQPALTEPVQGQVSDLAIEAEELLRMRSLLAELLARHTGRDRALIAEDLERDLHLDARQAVEYGLADQLVGSRKGPSGGN
ncbi:MULTISPECIES: ATP-dependent Clp protease proteolytic subunit [Streptomyces]|uniref:ATP-dependent Clp protease proteolytic subunit n=1 Tax=Streptomyces TaxID=1883 RepID=UPI0010203042|nr:ATP-dependent Clp protease proteolytic subunit [Streptomyces sp. SCA2-2]RZE89465.1 ATP-dependent Clp protease proteolytic subunit [Streptomyces sp. SCA2-2]